MRFRAQEGSAFGRWALDMDIYLDDEPVAVVDAETSTVEQLVGGLRSRLADTGRLLTGDPVRRPGGARRRP